MLNMQTTPGDKLRLRIRVDFNQVFHRRGFTLLELLVCIVVVSVLAVCAFSAQQKLGHSSRSAQCVSNLRQIYAIFQLYMGDHNGCFPPGNSQGNPPAGGDWTGMWYGPNKTPSGAEVGPAAYAGGLAALHKISVCPENRHTPMPGSMYNPVGYPYTANYNVMSAAGSTPPIPAKRLTAIFRPAGTVLLLDSVLGSMPGATYGAGFNNLAQMLTFASNRHQPQLNVLWADGHVSGMKKEEITTDNIINPNK